MTRFAFTLYCQDVRYEIGDTQTYVGILGTAIIVPTLPSILPQLVVVCNVSTPIEDPFQKLRLTLVKNGEPGPSIEFNPQEMMEGVPKSGNPRARTIIATSILKLHSVVIDKEGEIGVLIETERDRIETNKLTLKVAEQQQSSPVSPADAPAP